jgi:hypothetical protein
LFDRIEDGQSRLPITAAGEEQAMFIGIGTIVFIAIVVVIVLALRRA